MKKGNPSFRVHYSIIKNYFFKNVHIIGKLMFSSFIWHHKHDQWITHDRLHTIWSSTDRNPIVQNRRGRIMRQQRGVIRRAMRAMRTRAQACVDKNGGHVEGHWRSLTREWNKKFLKQIDLCNCVLIPYCIVHNCLICLEQNAIPSTYCSVMRDPSIMIMVSYERRENELSNDVYIVEKIILNYWVMYPKTWVSFFQGHPVWWVHVCA